MSRSGRLTVQKMVRIIDVSRRAYAFRQTPGVGRSSLSMGYFDPVLVVSDFPI